MKDQKTKEKFVQLRGEGRSFDSISDELNVSKTTLIKWSRELDREINNFKFLAYQNLMEQYRLTKKERLDFLIGELQKVNEALTQKDYNELSVKDLIFVKEKLEKELKEEIGDTVYRTGEFEEMDLNLLNELTYKSEIIANLE